MPLATNIIFSKLDYMRETEPGQAFFGVEYLSGNLVDAMIFMFNPDLEGMNSSLLSGLGLFGLVLFGVNYVSVAVKRGSVHLTEDNILVVFTMVVACLFTIYMATFWGGWTDYLVSRFSLPIYFLLLVMAARVGGGLLKGRELPMWSLACIVLWVFLFSLPASGRAFATRALVPSREGVVLQDVLPAFKPEQTLLIVTSPIMPILDGYAACSIAGVKQEPWKVQAALDLGFYENVLLIQQERFSYKERRWVTYREQVLSDDFELTSVGTYDLGSSARVRIEKVVGLHDKALARKLIEEGQVPKAENRLDYFKQVVRLLP